MGKTMPLLLCHTRIQKFKIKTLKNLSYIPFLFLLMLTHASCGVFTKISKHTQHEVKQSIVSNSNLAVASETITKGDSVVQIESKTLQAIVPFIIDTNCVDGLDSIVSNDIKVFVKPVYHITDNGKMVFKGMQIKAVTPAKTIKPNYTQIQRSNTTIQTAITVAKDSVHVEQNQFKKRDNRLGGYTTIIIIVSLLCVGFYIAKKYFSFKTHL
jgi:hypothetical protein